MPIDGGVPIREPRSSPTPASLLEARGVERMQQLVRDVSAAAEDSDPVAALDHQVGPSNQLVIELSEAVDHCRRRPRCLLVCGDGR